MYIGPSDPKTGLNDAISYIMIVSWLLNPFSAILDFFDSYHALATPCNIGNIGNLAIFGNFSVKNGRNCIFGGSFFGSKNRSKSSNIGLNFDFLAFLVTLGKFWTIQKKNFFLRFFIFFLKPKNVIFGFLQNNAIFWGPKIASFSKNSKVTFLGSKKKMEKRQKTFSFQIVQNFPKVTKKAKNPKF